MVKRSAAIRTRSTSVAAALKKASPLGGVRLPTASEDLHPGVLSSGVDCIDAAIGAGGYPEGRITMLHGKEACGKTTLALEAVRECQRRDGIAIYVDCERKLDLSYAQKLGVDVTQMIYLTPPHIEAAFDTLAKAAAIIRKEDSEEGKPKTTFPILFVYDSLQASVAKRTAEGEYDKEDYAPEAKAFSRAFAKFVPILSDTRAVFLCLSQVRMKMEGYGAREKVGVGKAPLFYSSVILSLAPKKDEAKGSLARGKTGETIEVVVRKNQVGTPFKKCLFPIMFGKGVDKAAALLEAARMVGLAPKKAEGGGFSPITVGETTYKIQGDSGMAKVMTTAPETFALIRDAVRARFGGEEEEVVLEEAAPLEDLDDDPDA